MHCLVSTGGIAFCGRGRKDISCAAYSIPTKIRRPDLVVHVKIRHVFQMWGQLVMKEYTWMGSINKWGNVGFGDECLQKKNWL